MDFLKFSTKPEMLFTFGVNDPEVLEKLSFVHLIKEKFEGQMIKCDLEHLSDSESHIRIILSFGDWRAVSDAILHCRQNINMSGSVALNYKGALQNADPGQKMAKQLLNLAQ